MIIKTNKKIRIIHDLVLVKENQYHQIKKYFPVHELYKYNYYENQKFEPVDYNIYMDTISENIYLNAPCKRTILLVNEEYLVHTEYIRRENYIDKPLILIKDVVDYYFCFSNYAFNYLLDKKIDKSKLIMLKGLCLNIYKNKIDYNSDKKYILYKIDNYGFYDNLLVLNTWIKYFLNRKEILIIQYNNKKELFIIELQKLMNKKIYDNQINYYKNIIFFSDDKYLANYEQNIQCVLLISSYFNLITLLNEHIFKKHFIITICNDISKEYILYKKLMPKTMTEKELYNGFNNYFNLDDKTIARRINRNGRQFISFKKQAILNINDFFNKI